MRIRFDLAKDMRDLALLINDEGGAQHALHGLTVHILFAPRAVLFQHGVIGIGQQGER